VFTKESGLSNEIIRAFSSEIPTLECVSGISASGMFLGQCDRELPNDAWETSLIKHNEKDLFEGMPKSIPGDALPFAGNRAQHAAGCLEITAETRKAKSWGEHKQLLLGRSIPSREHFDGKRRKILQNFLNSISKRNSFVMRPQSVNAKRREFFRIPRLK